MADQQPEALRLATWLKCAFHSMAAGDAMLAAAELKRLHDDNADLRAQVSRLQSEVNEQARLNGIGAERELALLAKIERLQAGGGVVAWLSIDSIGERYLTFAKPQDDHEHTALVAAQPPAAPAIDYTPGKWYEVKTPDELEAFFLSRLPAIRAAACELGFAIGLHGSLRRDMDLIATPWRDGAAAKDDLAHAIANAACGLTREGVYEWEAKPLGRLATSIPVCWPAWQGVAGLGHIDLSVTQAAAPALVPLSPAQINEMALQEQFLLVCDDIEALTEIVKAVELVHGINGLTVGDSKLSPAERGE